ncbi:MAG: biotin transporter BioY [Acholeplasmatales bacterium]|nr:biotin transporter BioY [Acholeplasmatales bacterium]
MKIKDLCLMTVCLSILIVCSKISFDIGIISLTLQTFAVALTGYLLKWKRSAIVFITYIIMGLIGIPVFSGGGGFFYVLKPSFGFILGFLVGTFITGSNLFNNSKIAHFTKGVLGLLIADLVGLIYMYFILKFYMGSANASVIYVLEAGFLPFILKDTISVVIAGVIALRLYPVLDSMGTYNKNLINNSKNGQLL